MQLPDEEVQITSQNFWRYLCSSRSNFPKNSLRRRHQLQVPSRRELHSASVAYTPGDVDLPGTVPPGARRDHPYNFIQLPDFKTGVLVLGTFTDHPSLSDFLRQYLLVGIEKLKTQGVERLIIDLVRYK
jgi:hypothetical protein